MNIKELVGRKDQVRYVTGSVAGAGGRVSFQPGEIWVIPGGVTMPSALEQNSEPFKGTAVPHTALRFDPDAYALATTPRAEPPAPRTLTTKDILRRFNWTPAQFATAKQLGFPVRDGYRGADDWWFEARPDAWADRIRELGIGGR